MSDDKSDIKQIDIAPPLYPINKLANIVTQSKGEHWAKSNITPIHVMESSTPFKTRPLPKNVKNLIGKKSGRKTIIGYRGSTQFCLNGKIKKAANGGARWVTRCDCGTYGLTTSKNFNKSLKNKNSFNMCSNCQALEYLKIKSKKLDKRHIKKIIKESEWSYLNK